MEELIYKMEADLLKSLGHPTRIRILEFLHDKEMCACEIHPALDLEQSNVSQHLAVLRERGILETRREGTMIIYRVRDPKVFELLELLQDIILSQLGETKNIVEHLKKKKDRTRKEG
ncbi:MAG: winged helix-turn-helix transcriptional regulator [Firmicutes bacterium]|nr:winged helix-turn-helix transcriptional regulator [Bacillota bacterium]